MRRFSYHIILLFRRAFDIIYKQGRQLNGGIHTAYAIKRCLAHLKEAIDVNSISRKRNPMPGSVGLNRFHSLDMNTSWPTG